MKDYSELHRNNLRKTELGLVWAGAGLETSYRDLRKDYRYYRCTGTDGYRFGGERIFTNLITCR